MKHDQKSCHHFELISSEKAQKHEDSSFSQDTETSMEAKEISNSSPNIHEEPKKEAGMLTKVNLFASNQRQSWKVLNINLQL